MNTVTCPDGLEHTVSIDPLQVTIFTPKGLYPTAQGKREARHPGLTTPSIQTPKGCVSRHGSALSR
jgi:hypothetical protein